MQQLSDIDGLFVHMEMPDQPMHLGLLSIYDPCTPDQRPIYFQHIRQIFEASMVYKAPILKSKLLRVALDLDQPYWVEDPDFDLDYHLRHIALASAANWQALMTLVADLHAQPLSRAKPLWEAYVIDGIDTMDEFPTGSFALFMKFHHAIMDGRSGMKIFSNLHSLTPSEPSLGVSDKDQDQNQDQPSPEQQAFKRPSQWQILSRGYSNNAQRTLNLARLLTRTVPKTLRKISGAKQRHELKPTEQTPRTRFNAATGPTRVMGRIRVSLDEICMIRKSFLVVSVNTTPDTSNTNSKGATVNDVAMTIISGALGRYLANKNETPEHSLVASIPIDIRNAAATASQGNKIGLMNVVIRSDITDPLTRLKAVTEESASSKAYFELLGKESLSSAMESIYPALGAWSVRKAISSTYLDQFEPVTNTIITNVAGAPVPIYLAGAKMIDSFGIGPLMPKTGTFHTVSSTYEWLNISFTSSKEMMPDPEFYTQCLQEEYAALLNATGIDRHDTEGTISDSAAMIPPVENKHRGQASA